MKNEDILYTIYLFVALSNKVATFRDSTAWLLVLVDKVQMDPTLKKMNKQKHSEQI